ncbi:hypothetical protein J5X84_33670 [Streptosporangiaceae bacterium NEAU-GS5]|nr:hypothetical protein [Streptosporangiaceae bacterium NEAU-GS5]
MDLIEIEREIARLDAVYHPVATALVDVTGRDALENLGAGIAADLARLNVADQAETVLRAAIDLYATGDEPVRAAVRQLFNWHTSFRWAAHLPRDWDTAEEFRAHLVHLSARDQGSDPRDEILALQHLCHRARQAGIDVDPILEQVAAISSDVDRYGMGSTRGILLRYSKPPAG